MLENGKFELKLEEFSCVDAICDLLESLKTLFEQKKNTLIAKFSPNIPSKIKTDKSRMLQVLLNLLTNANKFTV